MEMPHNAKKQEIRSLRNDLLLHDTFVFSVYPSGLLSLFKAFRLSMKSPDKADGKSHCSQPQTRKYICSAYSPIDIRSRIFLRPEPVQALHHRLQPQPCTCLPAVLQYSFYLGSIIHQCYSANSSRLNYQPPF